MKYQLLLMGPARTQFESDFRRDFEAGFQKIGLMPAQNLAILDSSQATTIDWDLPIAAVWFGAAQAPSQVDSVALTDCLNNHSPVFAIVSDLANVANHVPEKLKHIDASTWNTATNVADVLCALKLARKQRQAFISYRRDETRGVAVQLFEQLSHRGYRTFLDTASIRAGVEFQTSLWQRMSDVDLLLFIDSPNALSSRWVNEELARAHDLGLGVMQLVWPGHSKTMGTELSVPFTLQLKDFVAQKADAHDRLHGTALEQVLDLTEVTRMRSLASRRRRVVNDIVDQAKRFNLQPNVHPLDRIELRRNGHIVGTAIPIVGLPDAPNLQELEQSVAARDPSGQSFGSSQVIYHGLGIDQEWADHLQWLNNHHILKMTKVESANKWLGTL